MIGEQASPEQPVLSCRGGPGAQPPLVSFVIAAHNEADSLPQLLEEIRVAAMGLRYEIVVVDDGSTDGTASILEREQERGCLVVRRFPVNLGQSAAMAEGLATSRGEILVTLDADLQNDPADTPRLLEALHGHDLVCGVRAHRRDRLAKRIASRFANALRRRVLRDRFRDVGCTLKAWRRPVAERIPKFRNFHRYIPVLAEAGGFDVTEITVSHRERCHGRTHYSNWRRGLEGIFDLWGVAWLLRRGLPAECAREQARDAAER